MKVTVNDKTYVVQWKHYLPEQPNRSKMRFSEYRERKYTSGSTECLIKDIENLSISLFGGQTYCSPLDQFNKSKGRIVSLTKAIKHLPKDVRKQFWDVYKKEINF